MPLTHGTSNGYDYYGCRCDACRAAWADRHRELRARRAAGVDGRADLAHGTKSTYVNYGCRCEACVAAQSEANRRRPSRARRR